MAKNIKFNRGDQLSVAVTNPATPASGDPVLYGQRPGVALTDERADGTTTVKFDGVADLAVTGNDGVAAAVAEGDIVYYDTATDTLNINAAGVRFGYAGGTVASGATTTIPVQIGY